MGPSATRVALPAAAAIGLLAGSAAAQSPYLTEQAVRDAIVGHTLDGHYGNGVTWSEAYLADGRLDYREAARRATGQWSFLPGNVFCTLYDPNRDGISGGCWVVLKSSANCFEFYVASENMPPMESEDGGPMPARAWNAQGWRRGEPSTCTEKPAV